MAKNATKKILFIEDETALQQAVGKVLRESGYEVLSAMDGEEGLRKVKSEKPDVVLLDIQMPKQDGLKTLEKIRKFSKRLPVYMLTAFSNPERFKLAGKLSASGFLVKNGDLKRQVADIASSLRLSAKFHPGRNR